MSGKRHKKELWLDPRAKLFLILMSVLSSMFAPVTCISIYPCYADCDIGGFLWKVEICH